MIIVGKRALVLTVKNGTRVLIPVSQPRINEKVIILPTNNGPVALPPQTNNIAVGQKVVIIPLKTGGYALFRPVYGLDKISSSKIISLSGTVSRFDLITISKSISLSGAVTYYLYLTPPICLTTGIPDTTQPLNTTISLEQGVFNWDGVGTLYISGSSSSLSSISIKDSFGFWRDSPSGSQWLWYGGEDGLADPINVTEELSVCVGRLVDFHIINAAGDTLGCSALYLINIRS